MSEAPRQPTVFLVDDDASFLTAVSRLLRAGGWNVKSFSSAADFFRESASEAPGCVVLDLRMPGPNGIRVQEALATSDHPRPVIFLTGHGDIPTSVKAMQMGAVDFLTKPVKKEPLFWAVERALAKDAADRQQRARRRELQERYERLTPREREVVAHVVAGELNKEIASNLGTSERTIKAHRAAIMQKLGLESVADLVRFTEELKHPPR